MFTKIGSKACSFSAVLTETRKLVVFNQEGEGGDLPVSGLCVKNESCVCGCDPIMN